MLVSGMDAPRMTSPPPLSDPPLLACTVRSLEQLGDGIGGGGGCLVQTLSSHRLHVDTLFYNHMKFSEQLATCGSSGGVFHQRSASLFRDMTDKKLRK